MIDSLLSTWAALPDTGKYVVGLLFLSLVYSLVKKLVKVAVMIAILLVLLVVIQMLWDRVGL